LKSISFLFPGDIMAEAENELVHLAGNSLSSTVLIAPHHGSKTSSSQAFLNTVDPKVVIISSGRNNRFKFPHFVTLKRYENQGYTIWRTDISGAICLSTDGRHLAIKAPADFGFRN
jgi:competence protein ComEC